MRTSCVSLAACVFSLGFLSVASAQRGAGDSEGVARQPAKPKVVSLSGKVVKVETAACEMTTGRSTLGTHFLMKTPEGKTFNVHLGPPAAVEFVVKELPQGKQVTVKAFRTADMKKNHYVAQTLTFGSRTVELRDETLRPSWAGSGQAANAGLGRGWRRGAGYGRGAGRGGQGVGSARRGGWR